MGWTLAAAGSVDQRSFWELFPNHGRVIWWQGFRIWCVRVCTSRSCCLDILRLLTRSCLASRAYWAWSWAYHSEGLEVSACKISIVFIADFKIPFSEARDSCGVRIGPRLCLLSLFSRTGWDRSSKVECSAYCREVIQCRIRDGLASPGPVHPDITSFSPAAHSMDVIDGVCGGFPCQATGHADVSSWLSWVCEF